MATDTAPATATSRALHAGPTPAFDRRYLREGLPGVYRENAEPEEDESFAVRFMGALEGVLDPVVAMVDLLPAHLDMTIAPDDVVALVGAWFGLDRDPTIPPANHRRLVRAAVEITRRRGTLAGIRQALRLAFPHLNGVEVSDSGGVTHRATSFTPRPAVPVVRVAHPVGVSFTERDAMRRLVEKLKPAHVRLEMVETEGVEEQW